MVTREETWASQVALVIKNLLAIARDSGLIPEWERSPEGGHDSPLSYSCWEYAVDRGVWWAKVHRVAKSQTRLKGLSTHIPIYLLCTLNSVLGTGYMVIDG